MPTFGTLNATVAGSGDKLLVVLLHGFGAPGTDLVPLADALDLPEARFVFLEAPTELPPQYMGGRAWWMIDIGRFERAMASGDVAELESAVPEGMQDVSAQARGAFEAIRAAHPEMPMVIGGFSQGSMVALDVAAQSSLDIAGLVLMSSTLMAKSRWFPALEARKGLPCLLTHGRQDTVLPFVQAQRLRAELEAAGQDVQWLQFEGGHAIPIDVLRAVREFLRARQVPASREP